MRLTLLFLALTLVSAPAVRAARNLDPVLAEGLHAYIANGPAACLAIWYTSDPHLAAVMGDRLTQATRHLGVAFDAEVVAEHTLSRRVTRYYVAVYFPRRPLWIRIDRYDGPDQAVYLPLKCSLNPDDILPACTAQAAH